jgi:hypothetical protein
MAWRSFWSPDRVFVLDRDWPAGVVMEQIHARLNLLAGKPLSKTHIQRMATRRGLRRPAGFLSQVRSKRARERNKPPVIVPATPMPAPVEPRRFPAQRFSMLGGTSLTPAHRKEA